MGSNNRAGYRSFYKTIKNSVLSASIKLNSVQVHKYMIFSVQIDFKTCLITLSMDQSRSGVYMHFISVR